MALKSALGTKLTSTYKFPMIELNKLLTKL